ncbi:MAG: peptidoglycan DD-metalloendopeptidase family protein, partial [Pseudomonadota bacterium]|nr:peptidoglycan DD-metalloendopeptidase family protein [Pseudomonadota bacterium]
PERPSRVSVSAPAAPPLVLDRKSFRWPVTGKVVTAYGKKDPAGETSKGTRLSSLPGAMVTTPLDGMVRFAGNFRNYGQILIVQHADGYHSLIAGLGTINASVGQRVTAGEPVGLMPAGADASPLYYELRRHGEPVNPKTFTGYRGQGRGQG